MPTTATRKPPENGDSMDIRLTHSVSSLAGTSRAQATGTDKDRTPAAGGVAESQQINDNNGLAAGSQTEDRDADGRQLLGQHPHHHTDDESQDPHAHPPHRPHSTDPSLGNILDFDA
jgi:hypothetical protein